MIIQQAIKKSAINTCYWLASNSLSTVVKAATKDIEQSNCNALGNTAYIIMAALDKNEHPLVRVVACTALVLRTIKKDTNAEIVAATIVGSGWMVSKKPSRSLVKRLSIVACKITLSAFTNKS